MSGGGWKRDERERKMSISRDSYLYHLMDFLAEEVDPMIVMMSVD
jgi:hypothetical protein